MSSSLVQSTAQRLLSAVNIDRIAPICRNKVDGTKFIFVLTSMEVDFYI